MRDRLRNQGHHRDSEGDSLHLRADETGFSYEWLLHIGASTKREPPGEFAGHFGEGFKIAALCAARDFHWNIELASRGWDLRVVHGEVQIEGKLIRTLAYRVWDALPERSHTELCLWRASTLRSCAWRPSST
jgi:hypothetical protein